MRNTYRVVVAALLLMGSAQAWDFNDWLKSWWPKPDKYQVLIDVVITDMAVLEKPYLSPDSKQEFIWRFHGIVGMPGCDGTTSMFHRPKAEYHKMGIEATACRVLTEDSNGIDVEVYVMSYLRDIFGGDVPATYYRARKYHYDKETSEWAFMKVNYCVKTWYRKTLRGETVLAGSCECGGGSVKKSGWWIF